MREYNPKMFFLELFVGQELGFKEWNTRVQVKILVASVWTTLTSGLLDHDFVNHELSLIVLMR